MRIPRSPASLAPVALAIMAMTVPQDSSALTDLARADPVRGRQLAEQFCANCHVVVPGKDLRAVQAAAGFEAIANRTEQTPERVIGGMIIPHPDMPTVSLTNTEIRDIVGYIMSLKTVP